MVHRPDTQAVLAGEPLHAQVRELGPWLAWGLVAVLILQGLGLTMSVARGPAHSHVDVVLAWLGDAHALAHRLDLAHHHGADEPALIEDASLVGLDGAALSLLLGLGVPVGPMLVAASAATEARPSLRPRVLPSFILPPPQRPPRG